MSGKALVIFILAVAILAALTGCALIDRNEFGIYLVTEKVAYSEAKSEGIFKVGVASSPIISNKDIVKYHWATHQLELKPEALERLRNLEVPVGGKSFIVYTGVVRVYLGAFWTPLSSNSSDGIVILKPLATDSTITIQKGYPLEIFFEGNDPRGDERIKNALQRAGILVEAE